MEDPYFQDRLFEALTNEILITYLSTGDILLEQNGNRIKIPSYLLSIFVGKFVEALLEERAK